MPISTFCDHESNWLASVLTVLQNGGTGVPTANIQIAQSMTVSRSPRIEVECEGDERASGQMAQITGGEWYYSHRACSVVVRAVTNRTAATAQSHGPIRARLRWLFSRESQRFASPAVTLYQPLEITEQGSNVYVRDPEADHEDVSEFRFRIEYGILPSAVPTV
jgi:hypothetical protein